MATIVSVRRLFRQTGCKFVSKEPGHSTQSCLHGRLASIKSEREDFHMQKITPFLWYDGQAEEAMNFYISIFKNSKVVTIARYGDAGPGPKGSVMTAAFQLEGQDFVALNDGPHYKFTPAISFVVNCETQEEVDELWEKLSAGGRKDRCAWLTDKYGVSWQIVPTILSKLLQDKDPEKVQRVMQAMLQMDKIDIARLKQAYEKG
jgi:predicted 3-demethylubiquinone-9 3-methyltransferase (glyoxalase superfamily)